MELVKEQLIDLRIGRGFFTLPLSFFVVTATCFISSIFSYDQCYAWTQGIQACFTGLSFKMLFLCFLLLQHILCSHALSGIAEQLHERCNKFRNGTSWQNYEISCFQFTRVGSSSKGVVYPGLCTKISWCFCSCFKLSAFLYRSEHNQKSQETMFASERSAIWAPNATFVHSWNIYHLYAYLHVAS